MPPPWELGNVDNTVPFVHVDLLQFLIAIEEKCDARLCFLHLIHLFLCWIRKKSLCGNGGIKKGIDANSSMASYVTIKLSVQSWLVNSNHFGSCLCLCPIMTHHFFMWTSQAAPLWHFFFLSCIAVLWENVSSENKHLKLTCWLWDVYSGTCQLSDKIEIGSATSQQGQSSGHIPFFFTTRERK